MEAEMDDLLDRFQGCLVGLAVGDALGGPVEGCTVNEIAARYGRLIEMVGGGWLGLRPGETTDDTAMMLCIARSIVHQGRFDPDDVAQHFLGWFRSRPKDIGNTTRRALVELERGAPWKRAGLQAHRALGGMSAGNGSIMRCAPVALLHYCHEHLLIRDSVYSSIITHFDQKASWGAVAVNLAIARLLDGGKEGLVEAVASKIAQKDARRALTQVPSLKDVPIEVQAGVRRGEEDRTNAFLDGLAVCAVDREVANRAGPTSGNTAGGALPSILLTASSPAPQWAGN